MEVRRLARFLAPLAIVAVLVATVVIVNSSPTGKGGEKASGSQLSAKEKARKRERRRTRAKRTRYTVKAGDSIDAIAVKTRVSREEITRLNPDIDPQALQPGQRLKIR
jgi:LysM repeat protein